MNRIKCLLFKRWVRYFFMVYSTTVLLYLGIDGFEKKTYGISGISQYLEKNLLFLLLDRLWVSLFVSFFLMIFSLLLSHERSVFLVLGISWVRVLFFYVIILGCAGGIDLIFLSKYKKIMYLVKKDARERIVCKGEQKKVIWKEHEVGSKVRIVDGVLDMVVSTTGLQMFISHLNS